MQVYGLPAGPIGARRLLTPEVIGDRLSDRVGVRNPVESLIPRNLLILGSTWKRSKRQFEVTGGAA